MVDLNRCEGYAQCAFLAPDVFTMHGEEALLYDATPDDAERDRIDRAAAACPVQAIIVEAQTPPIPAQPGRVEPRAEARETVGRHAR
jgi:ferredoxin